ncbi:hypothetical protein DB347_06210 [Opitutaceae bacterium EW11]|nr:hypothetical protein DB347_06210 [Opitutaceae bacterium EW11]
MIPVSNQTVTPTSTTPLDTPEAPASTRLQSPLQGLSLIILGSSGKIEGPETGVNVRLETPSVAPEEIPLETFLQNLDSLSKTPLPVIAVTAAFHQLVDGSAAMAKSIQKPAENGGQPDPKEVKEMADGLQQQSTLVERSILDIIENSTYPQFSDFLKEMVKVAQQLREEATKAKQAAIESNYNVMMDAADEMKVAAEKAKESRDKQIEADRKDAIGQIVSGSVTLVIGVGFGLAGAGTIGSTIGGAAGSIITGSFSASSSNLKTESSELQEESDLANVAKQRFEAAAKLIESQVQVADDLRETARNLRDMVLKLYQDFIASKSEVLQRANV